jgi:hypothetical protein
LMGNGDKTTYSQWKLVAAGFYDLDYSSIFQLMYRHLSRHKPNN